MLGFNPLTEFKIVLMLLVVMPAGLDFSNYSMIGSSWRWWY